MKAVAASLVLVDQDDEIVLRPERATAGDPIICRQWDLGAPEVRAASTDRANADGTIDRAGYTGSRAVAFDLQIVGDANNSPYAYAERLATMAHPSRRPRLRITRNTPEAYGQVWEMELRGNPYSLAYGRRAAALLEMQLSFTAPLGYLVGENQGYEANPAEDIVDTGMSFPVTFDLSTGNGGGDNPVLSLVVGGSVPIHPVIYVYGPAVNPDLSTDAGDRFKFSNLTLNSGEFVQIDMGAGTVRLNGAPESTVFHTVDFSVSTFWRWLPGVNTVHYTAPSGQMVVQWRDRRISI